MGLRDTVSVIAGTSRGIGLATASEFLNEGARVVITGRNEESLENAMALLDQKGRRAKVLSIRGDMTDPADIQHALEKTLSCFERIDSVVANVGNGAESEGRDLTQEDWGTSLRTNLTGSTILASKVLPHLLTRGGGSLTFISSIAGCESVHAPLAYSSAKAALQGAMENLSRRVGPKVQVNTVAPGNVLFPGGSRERLLTERQEFYEEYIKSEVPL